MNKRRISSFGFMNVCRKLNVLFCVCLDIKNIRDVLNRIDFILFYKKARNCFAGFFYCLPLFEERIFNLSFKEGDFFS
jgi:hypothetical protein